MAAGTCLFSWTLPLFGWIGSLRMYIYIYVLKPLYILLHYLLHAYNTLPLFGWMGSLRMYIYMYILKLLYILLHYLLHTYNNTIHTKHQSAREWTNGNIRTHNTNRQHKTPICNSADVCAVADWCFVGKRIRGSCCLFIYYCCSFCLYLC